MALVLKDRVKETSTTTGTGTITLLGATGAFQSFAAVGNGNSTYYAIVGQSTSEWEVGIGTYTASGTTLSRDTVLSNSLGTTALINFSAGTKDVFVTYPSEKSVFQDESDKVSGYAIENSTIGATTASTGAFTTVTTPSVTATTTDLTLSAISTGSINLNTPNGTAFKVLPVTSASSNWLQVSSPTTTVMRLSPAGTSVCDFRINSQSFTSFYTGSPSDGLSDGANQMRVSHTASAVNYVQVTGSATGIGNFPTISSQGSDANVNLRLSAKGSANIDMQIGGTTRTSIDSSGVFRAGIAANGTAGFQVAVTGSQVNFFSTTGSVTGIVPSLLAQGTDTNISMAFQPKGTGAIALAAGSSGVNISNGGTVTAITRTSSGSTPYTSIPSCVISSPTTAGGVQATVSLTMAAYPGTAVTPAVGGTGYTLNDVLTVVGGTFTQAAQFTVTGVSAGVVTQVTRSNTNFGNYTILPTSPAATTGGTGTGCTLNMRWEFLTATITNAGSGYIEQPTVTFSGGGGSGASAIASVGGGVAIRSIGSTGNEAIGFYTVNSVANNNNPVLRIRDANSNAGTNAGFIMFTSNNGYAQLIAQGGTTNQANLHLASNGTGWVNINTNSTAETTQLRVSHTASAVNYVQVTGSSTTNFTTISAQGSDTNVAMAMVSKGTSPLIFATGSSSGTSQLRVNHIASAVNYVIAQGSATGTAPFVWVGGTDTNIPLNLSSKGTENVSIFTNGGNQRQFVTSHTASAVNYVNVTGSTTGVPTVISSQGSDANVGMFLNVKGNPTGPGFRIHNQNDVTRIAFAVTTSTVNPANYMRADPAVAGSACGMSSQGSDTNIDLALTPKGTGVVVVNGTIRPTALTASQAVFTDASDNLVSVALTGTGDVVLSTSPTLVTPVLGTPTSGTLTNCTGLPVGGISATGTPSSTTFLRGDGTWSTVSGGSGTVTSVSGTGTVNGITLTGTVTTSGSLTLGGTLSGIGNAQLTNSSVTVNGTAISLGASGTITANTTNALTIGTGLSGTSFNGSGAVTIANTGVLSNVAGTGISVSGATGNVTITNSAPMVYAGAGIAVSTGSAWGTSLTAPSGTIVGTTDTQTLTNKTLTSPAMIGTLIEDVFTITDAAGFAIDPDNGSIQTITLGASRTPTVANFAAGEAVTLMINDGTAFTITWTTIGVVWVGGTAPTLATTGFTVIELWRVGSTYYGALVGNVA